MDVNLSNSRRKRRTEDLGVLQSPGSHRVRQDLATEQAPCTYVSVTVRGRIGPGRSWQSTPPKHTPPPR